MLRLIVSAEAKSDAEHIASEMSHPPAAQRFLDEVRRTFERIAMMPTMGSVIEELEGTAFEGWRQCTIKKFRTHIVIYSLDDSSAIVHHVYDGRRDYLDLFNDNERNP